VFEAVIVEDRVDLAPMVVKTPGACQAYYCKTERHVDALKILASDLLVAEPASAPLTQGA
jgi:hypothetical protein